MPLSHQEAIGHVMELITAVSGVIATVGGLLASALGGFDILLQALLGLMAVDVVTGVAVACCAKRSPKTRTGTFNSSVFRKGLFQKGMVLAVVFVATMLDYALGLEVLRDVVILFYIAEEGMSIIENSAMLGVPIPKKLRQVMDVLEEEIGANDEMDDTEYKSLRERIRSRTKAK